MCGSTNFPYQLRKVIRNSEGKGTPKGQSFRGKSRGVGGSNRGEYGYFWENLILKWWRSEQSNCFVWLQSSEKEISPCLYVSSKKDENCSAIVREKLESLQFEVHNESSTAAATKLCSTTKMSLIVLEDCEEKAFVQTIKQVTSSLILIQLNAKTGQPNVWGRALLINFVVFVHQEIHCISSTIDNSNGFHYCLICSGKNAIHL